MLFALFDVVGEQPTNRLDLGVPRIACGVGMAVVAGGLKQLFYFGRGRVPGENVGRAGTGAEVFRLAYELDCDENH